MSTSIPTLPPAPANAPSGLPPYSLLPSMLGSGAALDFSQILTDQLFHQSSASNDSSSSLLGLPFASGGLAGLNTGLPGLNGGLAGLNPGLPGLNPGLGLGQANSGSSSMMETLMALSLVMLVERLVDAPGPGTAGIASAATESDNAGPTNTADEPNTKWPVAGPISQDFHPGHTGTDIAVPTGTPIPTTLAGKVTFAGWNTEGYGKLVIVENGPYRTYYAHLSQIGVKAGDTVAPGSLLGLSGSTGNSTGPHLHYEVRVNGTPVPPQTLP